MDSLRDALNDLASYADTCELFLRETHPGKAAALRERVTKARAALGNDTARDVPEGMVLVPVEPTQEMINAGRWSEYGEESSMLRPVPDDDVRDVYAAMLAAAPKESK